MPHADGAARALRALERAGDRVFGADANPLRQLGALAVLALWIAIGSRCIVYVFFDTSAAGALVRSLRPRRRARPGRARCRPAVLSSVSSFSPAAALAPEWHITHCACRIGASSA